MALTGYVCLLLIIAASAVDAAGQSAPRAARLPDAAMVMMAPAGADAPVLLPSLPPPLLRLPAPPVPAPPVLAPIVPAEQCLRDRALAPPLPPPAPIERLAPNIWMEEAVRAPLIAALAQSATLREQVRDIAGRRAWVAITVDPALVRERRSRATAELRAYKSGLLLARIVLPDPADAAELVAHELEHVRERLEGVNVRREEMLRAPGIWVIDGRYESQRAIDAGLRVRAELAELRRQLTRAGEQPAGWRRASASAPAAASIAAPTPAPALSPGSAAAPATPPVAGQTLASASRPPRR